MTLRIGLLALVVAMTGCAARPVVTAGRPASPAPHGAPTRFEQELTTTIDSDTLTRVPERNAILFTGGVVVRQKKWVLHVDRLELVFTETRDGILSMEAAGKVRVVTRDCAWATARRAEYYGPRRVIHLSGDVQVSRWSVPPRFKSYMIEVDQIRPARRPYDDEKPGKRRELLVLGDRDGGGDTEADI